MIIDTFDGYLNYYQKYNNDEVKTFIGSFMKKYKNIMEWIESPFISYFSNSDYYGEHYLSDLMLCTTFTDSDFIGKGAFFEKDNKNGNMNVGTRILNMNLLHSLNPSRAIVKTNTFSKESLADVLNHYYNNMEFQ